MGGPSKAERRAQAEAEQQSRELQQQLQKEQDELKKKKKEVAQNRIGAIRARRSGGGLFDNDTQKDLLG